MKLRWKVAPAETGPYRSFRKRGWPAAHYVGPSEHPAVQILCDESYRPADAKAGNHPPLTICVADHSVGVAFRWLRLKDTAATLEEAKTRAEGYVSRHPELAPKEKP